ncbi:unnamed protein product [Prunus armeniaca]|uniref:Uncharacterized protein n=1 Tax=Prunus armeniaca TaxID=36596 RepID=A0A6J5W3K0_PRUAR|nr:unnamed protein product [Prunus armeniaca]
MELKKRARQKGWVVGTSRGFRFQRVLSTRQGVGLSAWFPRRSGAGSVVSSSRELGPCRIRWSLSIGKCGTEDGWPLLVRLKAWRAWVRLLRQVPGQVLAILVWARGLDVGSFGKLIRSWADRVSPPFRLNANRSWECGLGAGPREILRQAEVGVGIVVSFPSNSSTTLAVRQVVLVCGWLPCSRASRRGRVRYPASGVASWFSLSFGRWALELGA